MVDGHVLYFNWCSGYGGVYIKTHHAEHLKICVHFTDCKCAKNVKRKALCVTLMIHILLMRQLGLGKCSDDLPKFIMGVRKPILSNENCHFIF